MLRNILLIIPFLILKINSTSSQVLNITESEGLVKWLTFEEAFKLNEEQPKAFLIDVYTDWCGWCKHMIKTTYSHPQISQYINTYFYPVKFNAETHDTIEYLGKEYMNVSYGKRPPHQLAIKLLAGKLSYPGTVFMNNDFKFSLIGSGYLDVKKIEPYLIYTVENIFKTTPVEEFQKYYNIAFADSSIHKSGEIEWHSFDDALKLGKKDKKKVLVLMSTDWCNGCRIMKEATFTNPVISKYLNENFYLVIFNAQSKDPINFDGNTFIFEPTVAPFHQFAMYTLRNQVILPSLLFLDEDSKVISATPYYTTPENLEPILHFFNEDKYKTQQWEEFKKGFESSFSKK